MYSPKTFHTYIMIGESMFNICKVLFYSFFFLCHVHGFPIICNSIRAWNGVLESRLPLEQNPQALVFVTITRVSIHERRLVHVMKHAGSVEPNVQQSSPSSRYGWVLNSRHVALIPLVGIMIVIRPKTAGISLCYNHQS